MMRLLGAVVLFWGSPLLAASSGTVQLKTSGGNLISISIKQISSCRLTGKGVEGWAKPPVQVVANGKTYWTSSTNLAAIQTHVKCKRASPAVLKTAAPPAKTAVKIPTPTQASPVAVESQNAAPDNAPRAILIPEALVVPAESHQQSARAPVTAKVSQVVLPTAAIRASTVPVSNGIGHTRVAESPPTSRVETEQLADEAVVEDESKLWDAIPEVYGEFVVQTSPRLNPFDIVPLEKDVRLKLLEPAVPSAKHSWYKVAIDGYSDSENSFYIDAHSLSLIATTLQPDGSYSFDRSQLPVRPRTIDVQVAERDTAFEMDDLAYVDPMSKNDWGGVLVVTKDGRRGYTAPVNLPKLDGIPLQRSKTEAPREVIVPEEEIQEMSARSSSSQSAAPSFPPAQREQVVVSAIRELPHHLEMRLRGKLESLYSGGKDPGYGHIDPSITNSLRDPNDRSHWSVASVCGLYDKEMCRAFAVNDTPKPSRNDILLLKAVMYHESHTDQTSFRYEKRFGIKAPSWIKEGWAKYKLKSKSYQSNPDDDLHFRQFHSSFGLVQVFVPVLSEWYPDDPDWEARPGGAADVREIIEHPARLLDPTTNFIWGIRIMKKNYDRALSIGTAKKTSLSLVQAKAATYNGGPGALRRSPPVVTNVNCRPGIDPGCTRDGEFQVPYHKAIDNIVKELKQTCNISEDPCGGI